MLKERLKKSDWDEEPFGIGASSDGEKARGDGYSSALTVKGGTQLAWGVGSRWGIPPEVQPQWAAPVGGRGPPNWRTQLLLARREIGDPIPTMGLEFKPKLPVTIGIINLYLR